MPDKCEYNLHYEIPKFRLETKHIESSFKQTIEYLDSNNVGDFGGCKVCTSSIALFILTIWST